MPPQVKKSPKKESGNTQFRSKGRDGDVLPSSQHPNQTLLYMDTSLEGGLSKQIPKQEVSRVVANMLPLLCYLKNPSLVPQHEFLAPFLPELPGDDPSPHRDDLDKRKKRTLRALPQHQLSVNSAAAAPPMVQEAIRAMDSHVLSDRYEDGTPVPEVYQLVQEDEQSMLTLYQVQLMKQLRHCHFTQEDRKTRGGTRRNLPLGFAGLACVHCARPFHHQRRFFCKECRQLTNSFSEIETHICTCRALPEEQKSALKILKAYHKVQMENKEVAYGSKTAYFRKMWRRLHQDQDQDQLTEDTAMDDSLQHKDPHPPINNNNSNNSPSLWQLLKQEETEEVPYHEIEIRVLEVAAEAALESYIVFFSLL